MTDARFAFWWDKAHLAWHMGLMLASAYCATVNPAKWGWAAPVLQAYGQITPPPGFTSWPPASASPTKGGTSP